MLHEEQSVLVTPYCPICGNPMGWGMGADNAAADTWDWCNDCNLTHYVERKYWKWNGSIFTEEQFDKALKLKAFW